ncbi:IDEAL domain-containing protein [Priestia megaterium]
MSKTLQKIDQSLHNRDKETFYVYTFNRRNSSKRSLCI